MKRPKTSMEIPFRSAETLVSTLLGQIQKLSAALAEVRTGLETLQRSLDELGPNTPNTSSSTQQHQADANPQQGPKNFVKQHMAQSLRAGTARGQPYEILKLLAREHKPQTMSQIAEYMRRERAYKSSRFYDASNALVEAGLANRTFKDGEVAWVATESGLTYIGA